MLHIHLSRQFVNLMFHGASAETHQLLLLYLSRVSTMAARMFIPMWASQKIMVTSNINLTGGHLYFYKQYIYLPYSKYMVS